MKKLLSLLTIPFLLSGCSLFMKQLPPEITPEKVSAKYTYKDYMSHFPQKISSSPCLGESHLLVIPVWFTDSDNYIALSKKENVRNDISLAYFGTENDVGWESVTSYYKEDSFNNISLTGHVSEWYECSRPASYYYEDSGSVTTDLVIEAVNWFKGNHPDIDVKDFDKDDDGYLDGVVLIYAAPDYQSLQIKQENLWAYCYWTGLKNNMENPNVSAYFWASYDFMYSPEVAIQKTGKTNYGFGNCNNGVKLDTHTYIHEMGHMYGLEDYYDYAEKEPCIPAGGFSMQDYNVGGHDPFSRYSLGWVKAYVPTESSTFTLKPVETSGEIVILSNDFNGSPFDEYIILELYSPEGLNELDSKYRYGRYPQGPKNMGVRIWHVDARLIDVKTSYVVRDITNNGYITANTNTTSGDRVKDYLKGGPYFLNHLIRNNTKTKLNSKDFISDSDLFKSGDSFSIKKFSNQFKKESTLNSGRAFNWSVSVNSINENGASISVYVE